MPVSTGFHRGLLIAAGCLLLAGCTAPHFAPVNPESKLSAPGGERKEEILHDSEAPKVAQETGALLPMERLLPNGVLDIGDRGAPLTLLVFTEHHCAYCREFMNEHFLQLMSEFITPGLLRVQLVSFPLRKYEHSGATAKAVLCSAEQGKGLPMSSLLFERQATDEAAIRKYADELALDPALFAECLRTPGTEAAIMRQKDWALSLGVEYVPSFFLDGEKFVGLPYYADLRGRIEHALKGQL